MGGVGAVAAGEEKALVGLVFFGVQHVVAGVDGTEKGQEREQSHGGADVSTLQWVVAV